MSTDAQAAGRSAIRRGQAFQRRCAALAQAHGFPHAEHVGQWPGDQHQGDLKAVGDRVIEITVQPWDRLAGKLRQAETDADATGLPEFWVWKPMPRTGRTVMIGYPEVVLPLLARLDRLEADALEHGGLVEAAEERGYRLGVKAGREERNA